MMYRQPNDITKEEFSLKIFRRTIKVFDILHTLRMHFLLQGIVSLRRIAELLSLQELVSNEDASTIASIGLCQWQMAQPSL